MNAIGERRDRIIGHFGLWVRYACPAHGSRRCPMADTASERTNT